MKKFRRLFAMLFILSIFAGAIHESSHTHHKGEVCEVCVLVHAPGLLNDASSLVFIEVYHIAFVIPYIAYPTLCSIQTRSRSPPIS
ncbi:MAG: hypothetical protein Q8M39_02045 [Sulfuricurvum sp.]|nr:hypothetical protein [Sulfuricurvum sp.]